MRCGKRIAGILLAIAAAVSLAVSAYGAEGQYTITIINPAGDHVYEAYQLFSGRLSPDDGELSGVLWGEGISLEGQAALGEAAARAGELKTQSDAAAFARRAAPYLSAPTGISQAAADGRYVITRLPWGYYLIQDQKNSLTEKTDVYTLYILEVAGDVTTEPKSHIPTAGLEVVDGGGGKPYGESMTGGTICFRLTGTVSAQYEEYAVYLMSFHCTLGEALRLQAITSVTVDGQAVPVGAFRLIEEGAGTGRIKIECDDLKQLSAVKGNSVIEVLCTAGLENTAAVGNPGNPCSMYMEFSNNPYDEFETGQTALSEARVFTYGLEILKLDGSSGVGLEDVAFELRNQAGQYVLLDERNCVCGWEDGAEGGEPLKTGAGGRLRISGLTPGTYTLAETGPPAGYQPIPDTVLEIAASYRENGSASGGPEAERLTVKVGAEEPQVCDPDTGIAEITVVNNKGAVLPGTGGMGTAVFHIAGGILLLCGALLLAVRIRMDLWEKRGF